MKEIFVLIQGGSIFVYFNNETLCFLVHCLFELVVYIVFPRLIVIVIWI